MLPRRTSTLPVILLALAGVSCAATGPAFRVHPSTLGPGSPGMPDSLAVVVADFPVGGRIVEYRMEDIDPQASDRASDALRDAMLEALRVHPTLAVQEVSQPPPTSWRDHCATHVLEILRTQWKPPADWEPAHGPPTLEATLGTGLRTWGQQQGVDALLVGWGQSVQPVPLTDVLGVIDSGSDTGFTTGMLQYVLLVVEVDEGTVLWMAEANSLLGGGQAVAFEDVRKDWVARKYVDLLLRDLQPATAPHQVHPLASTRVESLVPQGFARCSRTPRSVVSSSPASPRSPSP